MKRIFLGGTCNGSLWRERIIPLLTIEYFNPVVEHWTPECQAEELKERETCDYCLYVITPKMEGFYAVAEVVDDSNKRPDKTLFCILDKDVEDEFSAVQIKSLKAVAKLIQSNQAKTFGTLEEIAEFVNNNNDH